MDRDPIVEEVRRARADLLAQAGGDLDRLFDTLKQLEATSDRPVVSRPPKRPENASDAAA